MELLKPDDSKDMTIPDVPSSSDPFQSLFETLLYGDEALTRLRMKLCVADFCWVFSLISRGRASGLFGSVFRNGRTVLKTCRNYAARRLSPYCV